MHQYGFNTINPHDCPLSGWFHHIWMSFLVTVSLHLSHNMHHKAPQEILIHLADLYNLKLALNEEQSGSQKYVCEKTSGNSWKCWKGREILNMSLSVRTRTVGGSVAQKIHKHTDITTYVQTCCYSRILCLECEVLELEMWLLHSQLCVRVGFV